MNQRILVVDDDKQIVRLVQSYLEQAGYAVLTAYDGAAALRAIRTERPDLVVLDLMLPGIDGLSLLRLLRKRSSAGVLVVSGKLASEAFDPVINAGADMHLAKPVSVEQIRLAIAGVYRRSAAAPGGNPAWWLDEARRLLVAPGGARVELSPTDLTVLGCLLEAGGDTVSRDALTRRIGLPSDTAPNLLNATIYRLRRRIERATEQLAPLQTKSRLGYVFRAPLVRR